jgi:hypothetical protein
MGVDCFSSDFLIVMGALEDMLQHSMSTSVTLRGGWLFFLDDGGVTGAEEDVEFLLSFFESTSQEPFLRERSSPLSPSVLCSLFCIKEAIRMSLNTKKRKNKEQTSETFRNDV